MSVVDPFGPGLRDDPWKTTQPMTDFRLPGWDYFRRPSFGGGLRPTGTAASPQVCGLQPPARASAAAPSPTPAKKGAGTESEGSQHDEAAPWMKTARAEIGVAEYRGMHRANPRIMQYFKASKFWGADDSSAKNAWCGSFVAWVLQQHNIAPVRKAYRAKEWKNFGKKIGAPVYGAIGIKSRKGGGHVAFVVGKDEAGTSLFMLGGNQDDKVQISEYPLSVWDTFVVPADYDTDKAELPVHGGKAARAGQES